MELIFKIILYVDVVLALASLFFAIVLLSRSRDSITFNFGMMVLSVFFWIVSILLLFFPLIPQASSTLFLNLSFLFGALVAHFFYIFTVKFPFTKNKNTKILLLNFFTLILSVSIFWPGLYGREVILDFPFLHVDINPLGLGIFTTYFVLVGVFAFKNLLVKFFSTDGIHKIQLKKIIAGTFITFIVNAVVSIFIYFFIDIDLTPIGILFTFSILMYIYSIIFQKK